MAGYIVFFVERVSRNALLWRLWESDTCCTLENQDWQEQKEKQLPGRRSVHEKANGDAWLPVSLSAVSAPHVDYSSGIRKEQPLPLQQGPLRHVAYTSCFKKITVLASLLSSDGPCRDPGLKRRKGELNPWRCGIPEVSSVLLRCTCGPKAVQLQ